MPEGPIVGANRCTLGHCNDASDPTDHDDYISKHHNEGKVWTKGAEVIVNPDIGLSMYIASHDHADVCNVTIDMLPPCCVK